MRLLQYFAFFITIKGEIIQIEKLRRTNLIELNFNLCSRFNKENFLSNVLLKISGNTPRINRKNIEETVKSILTTKNQIDYQVLDGIVLFTNGILAIYNMWASEFLNKYANELCNDNNKLYKAIRVLSFHNKNITESAIYQNSLFDYLNSAEKSITTMFDNILIYVNLPNTFSRYLECETMIKNLKIEIKNYDFDLGIELKFFDKFVIDANMISNTMSDFQKKLKKLSDVFSDKSAAFMKKMKRMQYRVEFKNILDYIDIKHFKSILEEQLYCVLEVEKSEITLNYNTIKEWRCELDLVTHDYGFMSYISGNAEKSQQKNSNSNVEESHKGQLDLQEKYESESNNKLIQLRMNYKQWNYWIIGSLNTKHMLISSKMLLELNAQIVGIISSRLFQGAIMFLHQSIYLGGQNIRFLRSCLIIFNMKFNEFIETYNGTLNNAVENVHLKRMQEKIKKMIQFTFMIKNEGDNEIQKIENIIKVFATEYGPFDKMENPSDEWDLKQNYILSTLICFCNYIDTLNI